MADEKKVDEKKAVYAEVIVLKIFTVGKKLVRPGDKGVKIDSDFVAKMTANGFVKVVK